MGDQSLAAFFLAALIQSHVVKGCVHSPLSDSLLALDL